VVRFQLWRDGYRSQRCPAGTAKLQGQCREFSACDPFSNQGVPAIRCWKLSPRLHQQERKQHRRDPLLIAEH
jgi:hypothetical protein